VTPHRHEKPSILSRIPLDNHAVIEASAGTGKTYTLENLIIELLLRGVTIDQILVVTFTEKATAELRIRVRNKLDELVMLGTARAPDDLPDDRVWVLDDEARSKLARALQSFDSATIATIHAFCQRVLTEQAFANRRLFTQEQVDGRHAFSVAFKEALREDFARSPDFQGYLRAALASGYRVESLEDELYACHRAAGALEPEFRPDHLAEVLHDLPLEDLDEPRLKPALKAAKAGGKSIHGNTINAIIGRTSALVAIVTSFLDHREVPRFLRDHGQFLAQYDGAPLRYILEKLDGAALDAVGQRAVRALGRLEQAAVPLLAAVAQVFLPAVRSRLDRRKREHGQFDFDDMLSLVQQSLEGHGGEQLTRALRARYRYALIDEFQDTDETQWAIFRRIFFESDRQNILYVIGDPKQSIYGFRGADVHTYVKATRQVAEAGGATVVLEQNFRSTPRIIEAVNTILDQRAARPYFGGRQIRYDRPVTAGDPTQRALDVDEGHLSPIHLLVASGGKSSSEVLSALGRRIAAEVRALTHPEHPTLVWHRQGTSRLLKARDIYVLTFSRREGAIVGESLRRAGVPHAFYKQDGLFDRDEALHVLDLLAAIDDPHDPGKRLRAWLTPFFGLDLDDAHLCRDVPPDHPLMSRLFVFHGLAREKRYERLFSRIIEETGVVRRELFLKDGERDITNYLHLFELLLEEVGRVRCTTRELVFLLRSYIEGRRMPTGDSPGVQRLESDRDAVQIMTMHKSKGLEAAVVFVAGGLSHPVGRSIVESYHQGGRRHAYIDPKNAPPDVKEAIEREGREEDERLLYVALTRAKARLYLPYFPPRGPGFMPKGPYSRVNERLQVLCDEHFDHLPTSDGGPLFSAETLAFTGVDEGEDEVPASLPIWSPPEEILAAHPWPGDAEFAALRAGRGGPVMTSYTAMQRGHHDEAALREEDQAGEVVPAPERGDEDLPGGAATGIFLHGVIEDMPFDTVADRPDLDAWAARPAVEEVLARRARSHAIDARHLPHACQLIHAALTATVDLGPHGRLHGLGRAPRSLREVEFLYPLPDIPTLDLEAARRAIRRRFAEEESPHEVTVERGYVKGFIDFLFEHEGRLYFADWKSDGLRSWSHGALEQHVLGSYPRQLQLYSLALVKMLGIRDEADHERRFGGALYCFLRAMPLGEGEGLYFWRPSWQQIVDWEEDLVRYAHSLSDRSRR
jgi:exodeoxyribonuclease V beta subunit